MLNNKSCKLTHIFWVVPEKCDLDLAGGILLNQACAGSLKLLNASIAASNCSTVVVATHLHKSDLCSAEFYCNFIFSGMCLKQYLCSALGNTVAKAGMIPCKKEHQSITNKPIIYELYNRI